MLRLGHEFHHSSLREPRPAGAVCLPRAPRPRHRRPARRRDGEQPARQLHPLRHGRQRLAAPLIAFVRRVREDARPGRRTLAPLRAGPTIAHDGPHHAEGHGARRRPPSRSTPRAICATWATGRKTSPARSPSAGLELTDAHWELIHFLRAYWARSTAQAAGARDDPPLCALGRRSAATTTTCTRCSRAAAAEAGQPAGWAAAHQGEHWKELSRCSL